jgi:hypothetical protein
VLRRSVAPLERREAGELDAHGVGAGPHGGEDERAGLVRGRHAALAGFLVDQRDGGTGDDLAGLIDDRAGDPAGNRLRGGGAGDQGGERDQQGEQQTAPLNGHRDLLRDFAKFRPTAPLK